MTKDEALKLALEALVEMTRVFMDTEGSHGVAEQTAHDVADKAITALRAALEEQPAEQEPVAWMYPYDLERFETSETYAPAYSIRVGSPVYGDTVPLYKNRQPAALVRAAALEEAAVVANDFLTKGRSPLGRSVAAAIRALKGEKT